MNDSKMILSLLKIYFIMAYAVADEFTEENKHSEIIQENENEKLHSFLPMENVDFIEGIEPSLKKMENIGLSAEKSRREGILPVEHTQELYIQMVETLDDIIEQLKESKNTYRFLNSKGVDRIITPIIGINHEPLKERLLILIKTLFYIAPTTTKALIPTSVIDKLLDIFEHDDNLALKAHALDIMYVWLPNNPAIQARVMKLKGLEPFYNQVSKLDITVTHTLLDLFNKILKEHLQARDNRTQRSKNDFDKMNIYQMIGLIERMSTPHVCNGVLNILESFISFPNEDKQIPLSIFDLLNNIKPFCLKIYKGKPQAIKLFDELKNYVMDPSKEKLFQQLGINWTDVKVAVEDFAINVKDHVRDEF